MEKYIPDMYKDNIYTIDYNKLKNQGVTCLLFDLDNTLAPFHKKTVDKAVEELFMRLKEEGFKVIIFSNSPKGRVQNFGEALDVDFLANARKPSKVGFNIILNKYKYNISEIAIIGDQLLTDIAGGNRIGITTILIEPVSVIEPIWTRINRYLERRIIKKLENRDLFFKGRYYD